ncbi:hypothetical protein C8J57DRAFT_1335817 [Mycena rebaudengoi]|nr:hypothetical protein C8J57DRAFT_1335817 [Mycena rebaudengoi]
MQIGLRSTTASTLAVLSAAPTRACTGHEGGPCRRRLRETCVVALQGHARAGGSRGSARRGRLGLRGTTLEAAVVVERPWVRWWGQ